MALITDEQKAALVAQHEQENSLVLVHLANPLLNWHWYLYAGEVHNGDFFADGFVCNEDGPEYGSISLRELEAASEVGRVFFDDDWDPLPVAEQFQRLEQAYASDAAFKPWYHHLKTA